MLRLTTTNDKIQVVLETSVTTRQLQLYASWKDFTDTTCSEGRNVALTNNTTDVDLVGSPPASTYREVDYLSVYNADTVNSTVTVKFDISGAETILQKVTLASGETLIYSDKNGFYTLDSSARIKNAYFQNSGIPVVNNLNVVVLNADVVNNNATANTMQDVTGLSFDVVAGETYWFEFIIPYTSAATTTGSRWSINGPAFSMLSYTSEYTLTATTKTVNSASTYDNPTTSNATSLTTGNVATIWGIIKASANGTVIARFASEVASSAITAKAGAILRWIRIA